MCDGFSFKTMCAYCLKKVGAEIDAVYPVYDWKSNQLIGYYCKDHFLKVKYQNLQLILLKKQKGSA
ncbi:hypothetical protein [Heyndrickxia ginsengihumi]|uniref:Uncharacterized protein n=1 Tax=Heyndrickxia ginsengihumi TaxID=363870 RepID=A0A6M0PA50_9BACI|nr:hypothetical protein [Heyndrickxia ginsengihumi]MBE6183800.1 hypothetical protein [Bacillus sp. (in: firmicutes)]MCM3023785.1 hypothetical protein [Heyndrickxia ginsengihumi]NEY21277.1 hypothetical protein [Heyndrickxia ginsengihumi]